MAVSTSTIFFILLSIFVIIYIIRYMKTDHRLHVLFELLFLGAYISLILILLFPQLLVFFERVFRIQSAINFFVYLSIFIAYFLLFLLYNKLELQRIEMTKLTREIALLTRKKKK